MIDFWFPVNQVTNKLLDFNLPPCLNVVFFILGDSPVSEFRRQGITQKKEYNNKPTINNSMEKSPYSCGAYGGGERCAPGSGVETWGKENIGETQM